MISSPEEEHSCELDTCLVLFQMFIISSPFPTVSPPLIRAQRGNFIILKQNTLSELIFYVRSSMEEKSHHIGGLVKSSSNLDCC